MREDSSFRFLGLKAVAVLLCNSFFIPSAGENGPDGSIGSFEDATACAVTPGGIIYVLDGGKNEISRFSAGGSLLGRAGGFGWAEGSFDHPEDLCSPNDLDLYVADYGNHRIQRFDRNLNFVSSFDGQQENQSERIFGYPRSVGLSTAGFLFITDGENRQLVEVSSGNEVQREFGGVGSGAGTLSQPSRVRVSEDDLIYVQDGNRVVEYDLFGNYIRTIGEGLFSHLRAFTVNRKDLYVLDSCRIISAGAEGGIVPVVLSDTALNLCDVRDIAARKDSLYLLMQHRLLIEKIDTTSVK